VADTTTGIALLAVGRSRLRASGRLVSGFPGGKGQ
jgi:hypothetical protein